jgi:PEP-CTERM motif
VWASWAATTSITNYPIVSATVTSVPEPGTLALLTFGLLGVGAIASRTVRPKTTDQGVIQSLTGSSFGPSGLAKRTT